MLSHSRCHLSTAIYNRCWARPVMGQHLPQLQHHPRLQPSTSIAKVRWCLLRAPSAAMGGGGLLTSSLMFFVLCLPRCFRPLPPHDTTSVKSAIDDGGGGALAKPSHQYSSPLRRSRGGESLMSLVLRCGFHRSCVIVHLPRGSSTYDTWRVTDLSGAKA